jgi:ABC-type transporter Mla subunit MlaD
MSESLALILIFGGIALLAVILVVFALIEVAGEHRSNVAALHRHGHA